MKLLNNNKENKDFEPFELNLLVETPEEARLLYHVFNRRFLKNIIFNDHYIRHYNYNDNITCYIGNDSIRNFIAEHVKIEK